MVTLVCPVRNCGQSLQLSEKMFICTNRHTFDVARSGYCNLLQPNDRRSLQPGDTKEMVQARRRFVDRGHAAPLAEEIRRLIGGYIDSEHFSILDAGCGEGYSLGSILSAFPGADAWGVDISSPAVEAAARKYPDGHWIVANADRLMPFGEGSFDVVMSVTARKNAPEFRRIIAPEGRLIVVIPGEDDQVELREAVLGEGVQKDRKESTLAHFATHFTLEKEMELRYRASLDAGALHDIFALSYRGVRRQAAERLALISRLDITLSYRIFCFSPLPSHLLHDSLPVSE